MVKELKAKELEGAESFILKWIYGVKRRKDTDGRQLE